MQNVAPFLAAWRRRAGNRPGPAPAAGTGEASTGDPVQIEMWVRGTWIDITSYVMVRDNSGRVDIQQYGIRAEGSQAEPAVGRMQLKNQDARFSPRNPEGPYYGAIGRNSPMRISVPDGNGGKSYRLWGEVSEWAPGWDPTGTDVWVDVTVSGILRRLTQGPAPAHSPLYVALTDPASPNLRAYWPFEDVSSSTSISSPLPTGTAMTISGSPTLAGYEGFAGSDPVILMSASSVSGTVGTYADPAMTQIRFQCFIPAAGLTDGKVICAIDQEDYSAGSAQFWELFYTTTGNTLWLRMCASDGSLLGVELQHTLDVRGRSLYVSVELQESGTGITRTLRLYDLSTKASYDVADAAGSTALSRITMVQFGPASRSAVGPIGTSGLTGVAIGHATVEDVITPITYLGAHLTPIGETAGRRVQRICAEEGIGFEWIGDLDSSVALGDQEKVAPLELMREAEVADTGMLFESRVMLGLGYRTGPALCNQDAQLTLSYTGFTLADIPTPVEDDRYIANQVTITVGSVTETYSLTDGSLSTQLPPAGMGVYGTNATLNLASSADAGSQAAWRVHLGTVDEPRYPRIAVNLAHPSFTSNPALRRAVLALRQGDRVLIQGVPDWLPPGDVDQIVLGFEEEITHFEHRITLVCAPASPYRVGFLNTDAAHVDTDGSALAAAATATASTLSVATTSGPIWTADPTETPWDIRVGGEIMTVTTVGQVLNANPTFETDLSGWTATSGTLSRVNTQAKTGSWSALLTTGAGSNPRAESESVTVTAGAQYRAVGWLFTPAVIAAVGVNVNWFDAGAVYLSTDANTAVATAGTWVLYDAVFTAPVGAATATVLFTVGGTPGAGLLLYADLVRIYPVSSYSASPQTFTVTRSVNGVVKAQVAGEDLRLAYPTIVAL